MKEEKPSREERLKAYEYAREWLNEKMSNDVGICKLLRIASKSMNLNSFNYPELLAFRPKEKEAHAYWFSSAKERIQVLTKIINKMKEEPLIKPGQQFKIDSIDELKEAYEKLATWYCSLDVERKDFNQGCNWIHKDFNGDLFLVKGEFEDYETIPNPFKKEYPIREELKALREEVEKLKGYRVFNGNEDLIEVNIPEEKPKESEELKIKNLNCELNLIDNNWDDSITIQLRDERQGFNFVASKPDAIKIVNYLKKHFELTDKELKIID